MQRFNVTFPASFPSADIRSFQAMLLNAGGWQIFGLPSINQIECTSETAQWLAQKWGIAGVSIVPVEPAPAPAQDFSAIPSESDLRELIQLDSREG